MSRADPPKPVPEPRGTCLRCRQAAEHCWCAHLVSQPTRASLVILQHPREARNPLGTARMAHLSVEGSKLLVGVDFSRFGDLRERALRGATAVLYPAPGARDARELAAMPDPLTVIVIDGTWWQAEKIWRTNAWLRELAAYRLDPLRPSAYQIRAEPEPHCVSTLEAVSYLLDAVDGAPGRHAQMVAPLSALVERQLGFSQSGKRTPRRKSRTGPRSSTAASPLRGNGARALLFYAEGNGWPAREERPAELVQWLAVRPSTGERFECLVEPPSGRSPTMPENLELAEWELAQLVPVDEFRRRWLAFAQPGDLWCGWGHYSSGLLARAALPVPSHVDLRLLCNERLRGRVGSPEEAHRAMQLAPAPPKAKGRGGRRMASLEAIFEALVRGTRSDGGREGAAAQDGSGRLAPP